MMSNGGYGIDEEIPERWIGQIPDEEWRVYKRVIDGMRREGVRFALGGAFALATYSGHWRNTKDLDFYVRAEDRERTVAVMTEAGLSDYYDVLPYDRQWIYRAHEGVTIVDTIWTMANYRADVDERWISAGPELTARGEHLRVVPPEEMIWGKIYIVQRPRCDWPDIINIIYGAGPTLDWRHLVGRLGEDLPLLTGVMSLFTWLCPGRARSFPEWLWESLHLPPPPEGPDYDEHRVELLETRPWFAPLIRRRENR